MNTYFKIVFVVGAFSITSCFPMEEHPLADQSAWLLRLIETDQPLLEQTDRLRNQALEHIVHLHNGNHPAEALALLTQLVAVTHRDKRSSHSTRGHRQAVAQQLIAYAPNDAKVELAAGLACIQAIAETHPSQCS